MSEHLNVKELAEFLKVSVPTVHRWTAEGRIPCRRLTRKTVRYDPTAVVAALEARQAPKSA